MDEARSVEPDRPRASSPGDGRMRLLDDNPTSQDRLGFSRTADLISQVLTEADSLPLTVGVFGGWGTGKTSLMQMVQERLHRRKVKTVWFNAWKYDGKEVIWNAFLQTILLKMRGDGPAGGEASRKAFRERVADTARSLARYSAKVGTRFIPGGIVREEDVDALLDILGSSADSRLFEFINRFETEFDQLVREYVGDSGYLVIFIDDLDRCLPENAIQVLEALKLYLDRTNCVFVVGSEPAVIEEAIRRRYADNPVLSAEEYLEKIVQIPFFVPRVRVRDALLPLAGDIFTREETKQMELLVRVGTRRNPRRVKRFLNAFMIALEDAGPGHGRGPAQPRQGPAEPALLPAVPPSADDRSGPVREALARGLGRVGARGDGRDVRGLRPAPVPRANP